MAIHSLPMCPQHHSHHHQSVAILAQGTSTRLRLARAAALFHASAAGRQEAGWRGQEAMRARREAQDGGALRCRKASANLDIGSTSAPTATGCASVSRIGAAGSRGGVASPGPEPPSSPVRLPAALFNIFLGCSLLGRVDGASMLPTPRSDRNLREEQVLQGHGFNDYTKKAHRPAHQFATPRPHAGRRDPDERAGATSHHPESSGIQGPAFAANVCCGVAQRHGRSDPESSGIQSPACAANDCCGVAQ